MLVITVVVINRLRALYGEDNLKNAVHGSSTSEHAMKTIKMLFGDVEFAEDGTVKDSTAGTDCIDIIIIIVIIILFYYNR